jgi:hypothetical protein
MEGYREGRAPVNEPAARDRPRIQPPNTPSPQNFLPQITLGALGEVCGRPDSAKTLRQNSIVTFKRARRGLRIAVGLRYADPSP